MFAAGEATLLREEEAAARSAYQYLRKEASFLSVQDQGGHAILTDFLGSPDFRGHASSSLERGRDTGSFLDLFGNVRNQWDQCGCGVLARILGK